jgi:hypothetical protein
MGLGSTIVVVMFGLFVIGSGIALIVSEGGLVPGFVAIILGVLISGWAIGGRWDGGTEVCTVTGTRSERVDSEDPIPHSRRFVSTRECGEVELVDGARGKWVETGYAYRFRVRGGRWFSPTTAYRVEGPVLR